MLSSYGILLKNIYLNTLSNKITKNKIPFNKLIIISALEEVGIIPEPGLTRNLSGEVILIYLKRYNLFDIHKKFKLCTRVCVLYKLDIDHLY